MAATAEVETLTGPSIEGGTPPTDRAFRPDIEGLRAVAVVLVVLYHAGLGGLSGGYVGVDVFFVISGFVITGLLLRERTQSTRTSLLGFYGRRSRRIIPAATVVITGTVIATYVVLGAVVGDQTAIDARWTAIFLANFHFAQTGTNYLTAQQPPSPLLNFWSLAVEEQFYLVYPTMFAVIASIRSRWTLQVKLTIGLSAVVVSSFVYSVVQTASDPTVAYFSPLTRAWELALGALVAVGTRWFVKLPRSIGAAVTWLGLAAIAFGAVSFNATTPYPGSLVAVPVLGACLVIAGGTNRPQWAAESLLGTSPARWIGKLSYSIYLWHWPILIIAADAAGKASLPFSRNLPWLLVAMGAATASYYLIEAPVRRASLGRTRRSASLAAIGLGVLLITVSLGVATLQLNASEGRTSAGSNGQSHPFNPLDLPVRVPSLSSLLPAVKASTHMSSLPDNLTPPLVDVSKDWGGPPGPCFPATSATSVPACVFGDPHGRHTMVLYGDSHAAMWFYPIDLIAALSHWRLVLLGKASCEPNLLPYANPPGFGRPGGEFVQCDQWHRFALQRIRQLQPDLVIVTQELASDLRGHGYTAGPWGHALARTLEQIPVPANRIVVLGNTPVLPVNPTLCLSSHTTEVRACSWPLAPFLKQSNDAEARAATQVGARYLDVTPWFCSTTCPAVIGRYVVYYDKYHITLAYSALLTQVLGSALALPTYQVDTPTTAPGS